MARFSLECPWEDGDDRREVSMTDDERAIRTLVETWMQATRAGDTRTVLSLMADDVIFMVPGREPFGKQEFAASAGSMPDVAFDGVYEIQELRVLGDWAYLSNYIDLTVRRQGMPAAQRSGYTLTIMRREPDGRWLLMRDANLLTAKE
jgi:uncharacterized protein (TIGR02246 family)